jgi:hypothetical protein
LQAKWESCSGYIIIISSHPENVVYKDMLSCYRWAGGNQQMGGICGAERVGKKGRGEMKEEGSRQGMQNHH